MLVSISACPDERRVYVTSNGKPKFRPPESIVWQYSDSKGIHELLELHAAWTERLDVKPRKINRKIELAHEVDRMTTDYLEYMIERGIFTGVGR